MTATQVVEMSADVNISPTQDYSHLDDHIPSTLEMTPEFKPFFTVLHQK